MSMPRAVIADQLGPIDLANGVLLGFPNVNQPYMLTTIQPGPQFRRSYFQPEFFHAASLATLIPGNPHGRTSRLMCLLYLREIQSPVVMDSSQK